MHLKKLHLLKLQFTKEKTKKTGDGRYVYRYTLGKIKKEVDLVQTKYLQKRTYADKCFKDSTFKFENNKILDEYKEN